MKTAQENKIFILSAPERIYGIRQLDVKTDEQLEIIAHNIRKDREIETLKTGKK